MNFSILGDDNMWWKSSEASGWMKNKIITEGSFAQPMLSKSASPFTSRKNKGIDLSTTNRMDLHHPWLSVVEKFIESPNEPKSLEDLYEKVIIKTSSSSSSWNMEFDLKHSSFATCFASSCLKLLDVLATQILQLAESFESKETPSKATATSSSVWCQLFELFHFFSKNAVLGYPSHAIGKFLEYLVQSISTSRLIGDSPLDHLSSQPQQEEQIFKWKLLILCESLKLNEGVRVYVKELGNIKEFYRALTILLNSTEDPEFLIYCMAILARLVLNEALGGKLFSAKNVEQAFELIFSVLEDLQMKKKTNFQVTSVDLLCDLASQQAILARLEKHPKVNHLIEHFMLSIHLNELESDRLQMIFYFLTNVVHLSHSFRKKMLQLFQEAHVFFRVLQVSLHPSKAIGILCSQMVLKIIGNDLMGRTSSNTLFMDNLLSHSSTKEVDFLQQLSPILLGLFRSVSDTASLFQNQKENNDDFQQHPEQLYLSCTYLHSVEACQLLATLAGAHPAIRAICAKTISLNQSAALIQTESAHLSSLDAQAFRLFTPRLSIYLVVRRAIHYTDRLFAPRKKTTDSVYVQILLTLFTKEEEKDQPQESTNGASVSNPTTSTTPTPGVLNAKTRRELVQFLQSSEVSFVLASGLFDRLEKSTIVDTLLVLNQLFQTCPSRQFAYYATSLSESFLSLNQFVDEKMEFVKNLMENFHFQLQKATFQLKNFQIENENLKKQNENLKKENEKKIQNETFHQKNEKKILKKIEIFEKQNENFLKENEKMKILLEKKISKISKMEFSLQEERNQKLFLEEEKMKLFKKNLFLEKKIQEIGQLQQNLQQENKLLEEKMHQTKEELVILSKEYMSQHDQVITLQLENENLQKKTHSLQELQKTSEQEQKEIYQTLIYLSKAFDQKKQLFVKLEKEKTNLEIEMASMQQKASKQLETKTLEMEKLQSEMTQKITSTFENYQQELEITRKDHLTEVSNLKATFENEIFRLKEKMKEMEKENETKNLQVENLQKENENLKKEIGKQIKVQALIHQLSSTGCLAEQEEIASTTTEDKEQ